MPDTVRTEGAGRPPQGAALPAACVLPAAPDDAFDRFARLVRAQLDVPTAVVSVVSRSGQTLPGASGMAEPAQTERATALSASVCRYVVADGQALFVTDVRTDERLAAGVRGAPDVVAYAGVPLHDAAGVVVGALAAIDSIPRRWNEAERAFLTDLGTLCSSELAQRQLRQRADAAALVAEVTESRARAAGERAALLLEWSQALADTATVDEVAATASDLARTHVGALRADLALVESRDRLSYRTGGSADGAGARPPSVLVVAVDPATPAGRSWAQAMGAGDAFYPDRAHLLAARAVAPEVAPLAEGRARAHLPLVADGQMLGLLIVVWEGAGVADSVREVLAVLARYTARAVARARSLGRQQAVARVLQEALLTRLPRPDHLQLVARYLPAADAEQVGGDWYDAFATPGAGTVVVIGDVMGHDMAAAAVMGQVRVMARTLAWAQDRPPAQVLELLDAAMTDLGVDTSATAVLARIGAAGSGATPGARAVRWSCAGHPPPVVLGPDGSCARWEGSDLLLGPWPLAPRHDRVDDLQPGSTLVLYTDGLVERRGTDVGDGITRLEAVLRAHCGDGLDDLADALLGEMVGQQPEDDVAVLLVRLEP